MVTFYFQSYLSTARTVLCKVTYCTAYVVPYPSTIQLNHPMNHYIKLLNNSNLKTFVHSIFAHYSGYEIENMDQFATLKKIGFKIWVTKNKLLFKQRRGSLASSLLICKLLAEKIWSRL